VIPLSVTVTSLFNLGLNLVIVVVFLFAFGVDPTWTWLLFPVALLFLFVLTAATSMALSVLYVRFRDVQIIWVVVAQILFYATPILYPVNAWNDGVHASTKEHLLMINPLAVIFEQIRVWVLAEPQAPTAAEAAGGVLHLLPAAAIFVGVCVFAVWIFNREAPRIAEDL
jgi:ABC-2 type transport system permease protein